MEYKIKRFSATDREKINVEEFKKILPEEYNIISKICLDPTLIRLEKDIIEFQKLDVSSPGLFVIKNIESLAKEMKKSPERVTLIILDQEGELDYNFKSKKWYNYKTPISNLKQYILTDLKDTIKYWESEGIDWGFSQEEINSLKNYTSHLVKLIEKNLK